MTYTIRLSHPPRPLPPLPLCLPLRLSLLLPRPSVVILTLSLFSSPVFSFLSSSYFPSSSFNSSSSTSFSSYFLIFFLPCLFLFLFFFLSLSLRLSPLFPSRPFVLILVHSTLVPWSFLLSVLLLLLLIPALLFSNFLMYFSHIFIGFL